jgi:hypothetical protein
MPDKSMHTEMPARVVSWLPMHLLKPYYVHLPPWVDRYERGDHAQ